MDKLLPSLELKAAGSVLGFFAFFAAIYWGVRAMFGKIPGFSR